MAIRNSIRRVGAALVVGPVAAVAFVGSGSASAGEPTTIGVSVRLHAAVTDPVKISFNPITGDVYAGRDDSGSGGGAGTPVRLHRVQCDGAVEEYGEASIGDPDAVLFVPKTWGDQPGCMAVTGSVIVGGGLADIPDCSTPFCGVFTLIRPDETICQLFGPSEEYLNPTALDFDGRGRLLFVDFNTDGMFVSTGGPPVTLISDVGGAAWSLAIDDNDQIYVGLEGGKVRVYTPDGNVVPVITDCGELGVIACPTSPSNVAIGPGGVWGTDLYVLSGGVLWRYNAAGDRALVGTGFDVESRDIGFGPDGHLYVSEFFNDRILKIGCFSDIDRSGDVGTADLLLCLANWGPCAPDSYCVFDTDCDGSAGFPDLLGVLAAWGPCPLPQP